MLEFLGRLKSYRFPFLKPYWTDGEWRALFDCLAGGRVIDGNDTLRFEELVKARFGTKFAIGTNSGRSGLQLILESAGYKVGEVIVPSFGCTGTVQPILQAGLTPVFVDIEEDFNIDPSALSDSITKNSRAVIVPSLYGKPARLAEIRKIAKENGMLMIDDAAQAMGAVFSGKPVGTLGDAGIFSFSLGKVLSATAGGMVLTNSKHIGESVRAGLTVKESGIGVSSRAIETLMRGKYRRCFLPLLSIKNLLTRPLFKKDLSFKVARLSNIDAAICAEQLKSLDAIISLRRRNAKILNDELSSIPAIDLPEYTRENIFSKYTIRLKSAEKPASVARSMELARFTRFMAGRGIEIEWTYVPLHLRPGFNQYRKGNLSVTEAVWWKSITLPVNPNFSEEDMKYIASSIKAYFNERKK